MMGEKSFACWCRWLNALQLQIKPSLFHLTTHSIKSFAGADTKVCYHRKVFRTEHVEVLIHRTPEAIISLKESIVVAIAKLFRSRARAFEADTHIDSFTSPTWSEDC